jgi:hypothetical protein
MVNKIISKKAIEYVEVPLSLDLFSVAPNNSFCRFRCRIRANSVTPFKAGLPAAKPAGNLCRTAIYEQGSILFS